MFTKLYLFNVGECGANDMLRWLLNANPCSKYASV